jgi:3-oxoacyl-[acyl-carrier protein] reductase
LVTGGARGIGAAITRYLVDEGVKVIFTSRDQAALLEMEKYGNHLTPQGVLVLDHADILKGDTENIDILVNNAGSTLGIKNPFAPIEDYRRVMALDFELAVQLSNRYIPRMKKQGWGRIVNIASCSGLENRGPVTYCCAKAALIAYTRSMGRVLAIEAPEIVMSAILPGIVMTEGGHWDTATEEHKRSYMERESPLRRFGRPEEIAPVVAFYCSNLASFSHGAIVPVDAGLSKGFMAHNYL